MNNFLKNLIILIAVVVFAFFFAIQFGNFYVYFFPQQFGGVSLFSLPVPGISENNFIGFPLAFIFFLTLLFTTFGGAKKYLWIGILLIPAGIFEIYFDLSHIYFPIALGLIGWILGHILHKLFHHSN